MGNSLTMNDFASAFFLAIFKGWDSMTSFIVYLGCIMIVQMSGMMWYGKIFGDLFLKLAYPDLKTVDERKRFMTNENSKNNANQGYIFAMIGSAISVLLLRSVIITFEVNGFVNGALLGFVITMMNGVFGIMHPFFENRSAKLYLLHQGYHAWCFSIVGGILGATA